MPQTRNRLSFRIPWLIQADAEGPFAIVACLALVVLLVAAKAIGWW